MLESGVKYAVLAFAVYLTYISVTWSFNYANMSAPEYGSMIALVIAAVQAPILALNAYLAKLFLEKQSG